MARAWGADGPEAERLSVIERIQAAVPDADLILQEMVDDVRRIFDSTLCMVNIILSDTQVTRVWSGALPAILAGTPTMPREQTICQYVVQNEQTLLIQDMRTSDVATARRIHAFFGFCSYAGAPLTTSAGATIGTLCLLHAESLHLTSRDKALLEAYARAVVSRLELLGALRETRVASGWMSRSTQDIFLVLTPHGRIVEANEAALSAAGRLPHELSGRCLLELVHQQDTGVVWDLIGSMLRNEPGAPHIHRLVRPDGEVVWVEWYPTCVAHGGMLYLCGRDITYRRQAEVRLWTAAHFDALTGLPNRTLFLERLEGAIARRTTCGESVAVLFVDLDDFKLVNDSIGHETGDHLLKAAASRLSTCTGTADALGRLGGDEFVILVDGVLVTQEPQALAREILEALHHPFDVNGHQVYTRASIGVSITREHVPAGELLRQADIAMYTAKQIGKGSCQVFEPGMMNRVIRRLHLENDLRRAEACAEFRVVYQPLISLATGQVDGAEALIRWSPPGQEAVSPAEFVPVAERSGLILPIGEWVLREACRQARAWLDQHGRPLWVSVNLSPRQFQDADLVRKVRGALSDAGLPPALLKLEITETALIQDVASAVTTLRELRGLGIRLGIDDFGTGYSSLSYLQQLPVDFLKIDRSFIRQMEENKTGQELVHAIITLARALSLEVVAEGVETDVQAHLLRRLTCDLGQGYSFQRPVDPQQFADRWLR